MISKVIRALRKKVNLYFFVNKLRKKKFYEFKVELRSYFFLDEKRNLVKKKVANKTYFKEGENVFHYNQVLSPEETALIVMDPWKDSGSDFLTQKASRLYVEKISPLVKRALALGITVLVLTNDPKKSQGDYDSEVFEELFELHQAKKLNILYHQDFDDFDFKKFLNRRCISNLIYTGFYSNMCLIARRLGLIFMREYSFKLFFIPDASLAIEFQDSWDTNQLHGCHDNNNISMDG